MQAINPCCSLSVLQIPNWPYPLPILIHSCNHESHFPADHKYFACFPHSAEGFPTLADQKSFHSLSESHWGELLAVHFPPSHYLTISLLLFFRVSIRLHYFIVSNIHTRCYQISIEFIIYQILKATQIIKATIFQKFCIQQNISYYEGCSNACEKYSSSYLYFSDSKLCFPLDCNDQKNNAHTKVRCEFGVSSYPPTTFTAVPTALRSFARNGIPRNKYIK